MAFFGWKIHVMCLALVLFGCVWLADRLPAEATQNWKRSLVDVMDSNFHKVSQPYHRDYKNSPRHGRSGAPDPPEKRKPFIVESRSPPQKTQTPTRRRRITAHQMKVVGAAHGWRCGVCKKQLASDFHIDHVTPLHLGGAHEIHNFQPLCPGCHARKNSREQMRFRR